MDHRDAEKASTGSHHEDIGGKALADSSPASTTNVDYMHKGTAFESKLMRKIDLRLVPALSFMYGCSLIDRTNLPNARLAGMDAALGTALGDRYSIITLVFFVPYILTEIPGNYLFKKSGIAPRLWLPTCTLLFGVIMVTFAYAPTWYALAGLRVPLGAFEGLLFPGCIFLISSWYRRHEVQKRISGFYLGGQALGGFGNIIAYGFSTLAGTQGLGGWQWIFEPLQILMGVLTIASALIGYALVPNFPARATMLNEEERQLVHDRIQVDRHDFEEEKLTVGIAMHHLANWKIWLMGLLFLSSTLPAYAFAYFLALILRGFGFSTKDSQLLSAPPYIAAIIIGMIVSVIADRVRMRGPFIIAGALVSMAGSLIVGYATGNGVRYFGAFLAVIGCQSNIPTVMTWSVNNVRGYGARAINSAVVVAGGGIGGIIASVAFRSQDAASGYRPGLWTTVAFQLLICVVTSLLMLYYSRQNAKARAGQRVLEGHPGFLYTL